MRLVPPAPPTTEVKTAPIELDDDLTRRDAWMFAPLLAIVVALPIMASAVFAFSAWHLATHDAASSSQPASFAMRWPDQALPTIR